MTRPTEYRPAENDSQPEPRSSGTRTTQFVAGDVVADRYRLIRKLGSGGMGVVWVAHSLVLGVDVAIKLIRSGVADPDLTSRMAREAQATATLGHPAIVRVFDFGTTVRGDPFLVMELAHGETLAALLARERMVPPVQALQLILPLVDGLRCAHERGIVHRDIKPENVFIARDALGRLQPKLLDFGIAKLEKHPHVSRLTRVGEVLGSPEFMSPEQARGSEDIDARTDVWSTCVVLYEMITGELPFKVDNYNALMQKILHEQPVPTVEYAVGDRDLWVILAKGFEKSREKRWTSMTEFGGALAFWLYDHGVHEDATGNSVKALWLGGSRTSLSPASLDDVIVPTELGARRRLPTLRLKIRRLQHRVGKVFTPRLLAGAGALVVALLLFLSLRLFRQGDAAVPAAVTAASAELVARPSNTTDVETAATGRPTSALPAPAAADSGAASKPNPKTPALPGSKARGPARSSAKNSQSKSIRDFGF